ncbi:MULTISPECIES: M15 family metallopeptidase [Pseudoalteromonas]|uniref:M15 family metallopeptidase n=1 Tax=Pseudoalteromonas obscura TaxID=3048491 RepID=A0ABT7EEZ1_9GAMM|nr:MULTISPECIES: M15 family metallopeptidase [Pseudoalteromonas]MBQ4835913.1 M15 family metallopeptidase [Pseudoalteromonas luteoviolacea]MDK2593842.1 M15 family metallopeptidase [Pseudoalteromonas sp. P94(2023)]
MKTAQLQALGLDQTHLVDYQGQLVHAQVVESLDALNAAAKSAGFDFTIASSYRDFHRQSMIWNAKFSGQRPVLDQNNDTVDISALSEAKVVEAIMLFSALPGTSRHHFGSDFDVYASNYLQPEQSLQLEPWEYQFDGPFYDFACWLDSSLQKFGFFRPYDKFRGGVAEEPWHISHIETSKTMMDQVSLSAIYKAIETHDVLGKAAILENLPRLYSQFVTNIANS